MRMTIAAIALVTAVICTATPALAYLDPGTGSMIAQVVIGAIAAALVSIKLAWRRIKRAFLSLFGREGEPDADPKRGN